MSSLDKPPARAYPGPMPAERFAHVETWVFDLDNTLYPPETALFPQINVRMTDYVMRVTGADRAEADRLRHRYWKEHGTTLAGLMHHHGVDPDPFLVEVHEIDFTVLSPDPELAARIAALPGRRIVYTNGTEPYARRVLEHRGLSGLFDAVYGVEHARYTPKPRPEAFETVFAPTGSTRRAPRCSRTIPATSPPRTRWGCARCTWRPCPSRRITSTTTPTT
jgi:putative hydrolase of the HAD superfamily